MLRRYWQIEPSQRPPRSDAAEEFRHLFAQSVENRMRGTPAVGAMLSGGLDSSSIACLAGLRAAAKRNPKLKTFSLVFDRGSSMDEKPFIDAVVADNPLDATLIAVGNYAPFADFERILEEQEGTFLAPGLSLTRDLYRTAGAKGVKVLLDGHGGDEVVSQGHGHLHELANAGRWLELWRELRSAANTYGEGMLSLYFKFLTIYGPAWRIARIRSMARRFVGKVRGRPAPAARAAWASLVNPELARRTDLAERFHRSGYMPTAVTASEALTHRWLLSTGLVPHAFEVLDKAAANFGVEPRYPFWDKPLVEFCLALPGEEKLRDGFGRHVLRRAMQGVLPPAVQWRRDKIDFTANLVKGMLGNHRELLDRLLISDSERIAPYVNLPEVNAVYARLLSQPEQATLPDVQHVWRSVSLSLWLRQVQGSPA
jgi:asparagine synthase (glutamine-hydrolysing)